MISSNFQITLLLLNCIQISNLIFFFDLYYLVVSIINFQNIHFVYKNYSKILNYDIIYELQVIANYIRFNCNSINILISINMNNLESQFSRF